MHHRIGPVLDSQWLWITVRILLALALLFSGLVGILEARGGPAALRAGGPSPAWLLHMAASAIQVCGAVLLMLGHWLWLGTAALAALLLASALAFQPFWKLDPSLAAPHVAWVLKDVALVGGLLALAIADRFRHRLRTALELYAGVSPRPRSG
ncbi:DoxX family protein [Achromobacter insuavis]|uniref:DoxX family protein n=1 Tax=Achromobacter insuavis TaxID=1287735 RepID=UPI000B11623E|nr:DoxX family protein [Achromobacter insuavis]